MRLFVYSFNYKLQKIIWQDIRVLLEGQFYFKLLPFLNNTFQIMHILVLGRKLGMSNDGWPS